METYFNDVQSLLDRSLGVEGESSIDFGRDLARDNLQDLLTKFDKETVDCGVDLLVCCATLSECQLYLNPKKDNISSSVSYHEVGR